MRKMKFDIDLRGKSSGQVKTTCPFCSPSRGNPNDRSLSVNIDTGAFKCHHCEKQGNMYMSNNHDSNIKRMTLDDFFHKRNISKSTLNKMHITMQDGWIKFPFFQEGKQVNIKSRSLDKKFMLEKI